MCVLACCTVLPASPVNRSAAAGPARPPLPTLPACSERIQSIIYDYEDTLRDVDLGQVAAGMLRSFARRVVLLRAAGAPQLGWIDRARLAGEQPHSRFNHLTMLGAGCYSNYE